MQGKPLFLKCREMKLEEVTNSSLCNVNLK